MSNEINVPTSNFIFGNVFPLLKACFSAVFGYKIIIIIEIIFKEDEL